MDPLIIAAGAFAIEKAGGKELLIRMFGPLADQIGDNLKNLYAYTISNNLKKLAHFANKKIKSHEINDKNNVQLSIVHEILNEAVFQDGDIFLEYYSGVIAASRANQNDIGKEICQIISRLSSYSLRLHYIIYNVIRNTFLDKNINIGDETYAYFCSVFISKADLDIAMGFSEEDKNHSSEIYNSCISSLDREKLILPRYSFGSNIQINSSFTMPGPGLVVGPSSLGASLLLWAAGYSLNPISNIFSSKLNISPENLLLLDTIKIPKGEKIPRGTAPNGGGIKGLAEIQQISDYIMSD